MFVQVVCRVQGRRFRVWGFGRVYQAEHLDLGFRLRDLRAKGIDGLELSHPIPKDCWMLRTLEATPLVSLMTTTTGEDQLN